MCSSDLCVCFVSAPQFFLKGGVCEAMNVYELFNAVTGLNITGDNEADFLAQVCRRDRKL